MCAILKKKGDPMKYQEYKIYPAAEQLDALTEALTALGLEELIISDPKDAALFEGEGDGYLWNVIEGELLEQIKSEASVSFYLAEDGALPAGAADLLQQYPVSRAIVDDEDWLHKWEEYYVPMKLSDHVVVKPVWRSYDPQEGELVVDIDPGMAFGTGSSPTSYLVVRLMEKYLREGDDLIDVGSGTGILSIVGVKLGAGKITALDLDPEAIRATKENLALNRCEGDVTVLQSDLLAALDGSQKADVIVANIFSPLIVKLAPSVPAHCKENAVFIASGIIDDKEETCRRAIEEAGFEILEIIHDDCWVAMAARLK